MSDDNAAGRAGRDPEKRQGPSVNSAKLKTLFNRFRGHPVETDIEGHARVVRDVRAFHEEKGLARLSDGEIGRLAASLRGRLAGAPSKPASGAGRGGEGARIEAFALVLEATRRATGLDAVRRPDDRRPGHGRRARRRAADRGGQDAGRRVPGRVFAPRRAGASTS